MKKIQSLLFFSLLLFLVACSEENSLQPQKVDGMPPKMKVAKMGDFISHNTRAATDSSLIVPGTGGSSLEEIDTTKILWFADIEAYEDAYQAILAMEPQERVEYFADLGFEGAYTQWQSADDLMEELFDNEEMDSVSFADAYYNLRSYLDENLVCFNPDDPYDATPYLIFSDDEAALLGNQYGYVAIGNELVAPECLIPSYSFPPTNAKFVKYNKAHVSVKNKVKNQTKKGSKTFKSELQIGRYGANIAFELKTWRTKFLFFKDYYYAVHYTGKFSILGASNQANFIINHNGHRKIGEMPANLFSTKCPASLFIGSAKIKIENFKCSKGDKTASREVTVVMR